MNKKILFMIAAVIWSFCINVYAAEPEFTINLKRETVSEQDNILEVSIGVENAEKVRGLQGKITYDPKVLAVQKCEEGSLLLDTIAGGTDISNVGEVRFLAVYDDEKNISGNICRITFALNQNTEKTVSQIRVKNIKLSGGGSFGDIGEVYCDFNIANTSNLPTASPIPEDTSKPNRPSGNGGTKPVSASTPTPVYTPNPTVKTDETVIFADTENHWARADIEYLYKAGIVNGVNENSFEPERYVTRAEFSKLISSILDLRVGALNVFDDVDSDAWYKPYVIRAYSAGLITGDEGKFRPNDTMTRKEMAVIISRSCDYKSVSAEKTDSISFEDSEEFPPWAREHIYKAAAVGIINGMDGKFNPDGVTTRAQAATVLKRLYDCCRQ